LRSITGGGGPRARRHQLARDDDRAPQADPPDEPFLLNPDLIVTVEATPDTVITLENGSRLLVDETPA